MNFRSRYISLDLLNESEKMCKINCYKKIKFHCRKIGCCCECWIDVQTIADLEK